MLKIYLARHGQNEDNANGILNGHRDLPLTTIGESQAVEAANNIKAAGLVFDHVFCSPLQRAKRTAEIIAEVNQLPTPQVEDLLIERDFGVMTGIEQSRVEELCAPDLIATKTINYFLSPDHAETFPDLLKRASNLLGQLNSKYSDCSILLVTHGDFGKMVFAQYYNLDWRDVLQLFHFGNSELLLLSEDSGPGEAHIFKILQHNS